MVQHPLTQEHQRFYNNLVKYTRWHYRNAGQSYSLAHFDATGNADGDPDKGVEIVFWNGPTHSYYSIELHEKAFMQFLYKRFDELGVEYDDWNINLTDMDDETWAKFAEEMEGWHETIMSDREDSSIYYAVDHLPEYESLMEEERESATKYWWEDFAIHGTPFSDLPESYFENPGSWEYEEIEESGSILYHAPEWGEAADQIMDIITDAANKGDLDIDEEELEKFYEKSKNAKWAEFRIRKCAATGLWAREEDMVFFVDSWVMPFVPKETHRVLPLFNTSLADQLEAAVKERMSHSTRLYSITHDMVFAASERVRFNRIWRNGKYVQDDVSEVYVHCRAFRVRLRQDWRNPELWGFDVVYGLQLHPGYEDDIDSSHFFEATDGRPFPSYLFRKDKDAP